MFFCPRGSEELELLRDLKKMVHRLGEKLDNLDQVTTGQLVALNQKILDTIVKSQEKMMSVQDDILAEVTRNATIAGSVKALVEGLRTQLQDAIDSQDLSKVQQALDTLKASDDVTQAVIDNTPAAPAGGGTTPPVDIPPGSGPADDAGTPTT